MLSFLREHRLFPHGETVVVAVSGGPDSLCLLHLLWRLRGELGIGLHAAHLDHMLRGEEAEADARFVSDACRGLGVPLSVERQDVAAHRMRHRLSTEEAARQVRYRFLARVAREVGAGRVVVGHTADDQVETVLMNLVRGAGARGLRGMAPVAPWPEAGVPLLLVRPLLAASRGDTETYCRWLGLSPRQDSSNLYLGPRRNRIRGRLLPLLEELNPRVRQALLRTARALAQDLDYLEEAVARAWPEVVSASGEGLSLDLARLRGLHPALQRHLLLRAAGEVIGREDVAGVHVEEVLCLLGRPGSHRLSLPRGLVVATLGDSAYLGKGEVPCPLPPLDGAHPLQVPGETRLSGWRVRVDVVEPPENGAAVPVPDEDASGGLVASMDLEAVGTDLTVRPRRPGDRFRPLGLGGEKKLQDFMVDARIPRPWRGRVPVVSSPQHILWLVGWRLDERVRVTSATRRLLRLQFHRELA